MSDHIIAALITAFGAIIAALIGLIGVVYFRRHSHKIQNVSSPQPPAQSYTLGRTVTSQPNINVSSPKQPTQSHTRKEYYSTGNLLDDFELNYPILSGFIVILYIIIFNIILAFIGAVILHYFGIQIPFISEFINPYIDSLYQLLKKGYQ